jgi:hypothetical protein
VDIIGDADELDPDRPDRGPARWRAFLEPAGLLYALLDGLIALGAAIAVAVLGLVAVIYSASAHIHAGPGDFFALAVWLTGASLGVPAHETESEELPSQSAALTSTVEVRVTAWLLTAIVLVLVFRLVRRGVRLHPDAGPAYGAVRAALTTLSATLALLVLALATTRASIFGMPPGAVLGPGINISARIGPEPAFVFIGPLLLTAAAALAGAVAATQLPQLVAGELARWRPVLRVSWPQFAVTGALTSLTLLAYVSVEVGQHGSGRETAVVVIGGLLLLPNLAIYGTLGGFGTTFFYNTRATGAGLAGRADVSHDMGVFGSFRPWILWLLVAAAVAGVLVPALLARRAARAGRLSGANYPVTGAWRATVTGLLTAIAVVLLGTLASAASSSDFAETVKSSTSAGPSLLAAAGLTALWLTLGYLVTSIAVPRGIGPEDAPAATGGND